MDDFDHYEMVMQRRPVPCC